MVQAVAADGRPRPVSESINFPWCLYRGQITKGCMVLDTQSSRLGTGTTIRPDHQSPGDRVKLGLPAPNGTSTVGAHLGGGGLWSPMDDHDLYGGPWSPMDDHDLRSINFPRSLYRGQDTRGCMVARAARGYHTTRSH